MSENRGPGSNRDWGYASYDVDNPDNENLTYTSYDNSSSNPSTGEVQNNGGCYLTSACMRHMQDTFDDNCEELTILRWFRDKFVSKEDIEHYYKTAPVIVEAIDEIENNGKIYDQIYDNVVNACVNAIKQGDYDFAYTRYKSSILSLEEQFAKPKLMNKISKVLKIKNNENTSI